MEISDLNVEQCIAILNIGRSGKDSIEATKEYSQLLSLGFIRQGNDGNFYLTDLGTKLHKQLLEDFR